MMQNLQMEIFNKIDEIPAIYMSDSALKSLKITGFLSRTVSDPLKLLKIWIPPESTGGVVHNYERITLLSFSSYIGGKDSNEAKVLAILEALRLFRVSFQPHLIVESKSFNVISWVSNSAIGPWKFYLYFNEIKFLSLEIGVEFRHILCSANEEADVWLREALCSSFFFSTSFPCNLLIFFILVRSISSFTP